MLIHTAFCVSHANILHKMDALKGTFLLSDIALKMGVFEAVAGIRYLIGAALNGSTLIVNPGAFTPARFFELVEQFKVTLTTFSAHMLVQILKDPAIKTANLDSIRLFQCGGSTIPFENIQKISEYLKNGKCCTTYGFTESFSTVAANADHTRNNCVGQLLNGYEAIIVNDHGERLGINETGELCIKFPFPFTGYLNHSENIECFVDKDGFFISGDEGHFDENGDLFIDHRIKEVFKRSGHRISPGEIEAFINHIEGVKQSCVVPIPIDEVGNVAAAIVIKDKLSNCTEQSISDAVSSNVQNYLEMIILIVF